MSYSIFYKAILNMVVNSAPSALLTVDRSERISEVYIKNHANKKLHFLLGKYVFRILHLVFGLQPANIIYDAYQRCVISQQCIEIHRWNHTNAQGQIEYFNWRFSPIPDSDLVIIYVRNITESVLIEQEFCSITEQHEAVNRELHAAMSSLDFHLMDVEQAYKKLSALHHITSIVQKTVNEHEVLTQILDGITDELGFDHAAILLVDEEKGELRIKAHRGYYENVRIPLSQGITGYAVTNREAVYVPDISKDPRYISGTCCGVSEVAVPLIVQDRVIGILDVETSQEKAIKPYDLDLLRSLASQIAMTIAHANYVAQVQTEAITDGLTGLYNYRYFHSIFNQEFKRAKRYSHPLSMLMIDIDYFKKYNDTHGHRMGDELLATVAQLIKSACRDVDFVVRYGGEEFVVLFPETSVEEAHCVAERIRTSIADYPFPNIHTQPGNQLTVSIGVACYPDDAVCGEELIDHADVALYECKRSTKNQVRIYQKSTLGD